MNVQGVSTYRYTNRSVNAQGVSLSVACNCHVDVQGVSFSVAYNVEVQGVSFYASSSVDVQLFKMPECPASGPFSTGMKNSAGAGTSPVPK